MYTSSVHQCQAVAFTLVISNSCLLKWTWVYTTHREFIRGGGQLGGGKGKQYTHHCSQSNLYNSILIFATYFGPVSGHHQTLHLKYLEEVVSNASVDDGPEIGPEIVVEIKILLWTGETQIACFCGSDVYGRLHCAFVQTKYRAVPCSLIKALRCQY